MVAASLCFISSPSLRPRVLKTGFFQKMNGCSKDTHQTRRVYGTHLPKRDWSFVDWPLAVAESQEIKRRKNSWRLINQLVDNHHQLFWPTFFRIRKRSIGTSCKTSTATLAHVFVPTHCLEMSPKNIFENTTNQSGQVIQSYSPPLFTIPIDLKPINYVLMFL